MQLPEFNSIDAIQQSILEALLGHGEIVRARGMNTLEVHPSGLSLNNPRNRCITNKARKWSLPLAIGELAWHLSGSNDLEFISYYAKQWENFSEDGKVIKDSCYGYKIFKKNIKGVSQWDNIIQLLKEDPFTRRAVLLLYDSAIDFDAYSKDVSCICTIQFLIRDNKIDAITHMRSNDVILGLPYDIFFVTMLQEYLTKILLLELGNYYHFANSMHLYERHFDLAKRILATDYSAYEMPKMTAQDQISKFLKVERAIRKDNFLLSDIDSLDTYWGDLLAVLHTFHLKKK